MTDKKKEDSAEKPVSIYDLFETDEARETRGISLNFGEAGKMFVARAGGANKAYQKKLMELSAPYRRELQIAAKAKNKAPSERVITMMNKLTMEAFAHTVVLGWEDMLGKDRKPLGQFSAEKCLKLFQDLPALFDEVQEQASELANFQTEENEGDLKNS